MPSAIPLDSTMGAYLIALIMSSIVYGVTCLQVYIYFTESSLHDTSSLKTFVRRHACMAMELEVSAR
jgi:hypothetical protein